MALKQPRLNGMRQTGSNYMASFGHQLIAMQAHAQALAAMTGFFDRNLRCTFELR
jgi:hypothetical protein